MLQSEYIKDMHSSYMVLKGDREKNKNYRVKMILNNSIPGLIRTELRSYDNIDIFYYDITGKTELIKKYETSSLSYQELTTILGNLINIIEGSLDYLLCEDDFIINPSYIFLDKEKNEILLCYLVGYKVNLREQFSEFVEYLMNKVDYKDEAAVLLVYSIYKQSKESDCTFLKIKEELLQKHNNKVNEIKHSLKVSENLTSNNDIITEKIKAIKEKNPSNNEIALNKSIDNNSPKNNRSDEKNLKTKSITHINKSYLIKEFNRTVVKLTNSFAKANKTITKHNNTFAVGNKKTPYTPLKNEIEEDVEVYYYPNKIYLQISIAIIIGISLFLLGMFYGLYDNELHTGVDMVKVICSLIILSCLESYVITRLLNVKNKITKMVSIIHYQDEELEDIQKSAKDCCQRNTKQDSQKSTKDDTIKNSKEDIEDYSQNDTEVLWLIEGMEEEGTQILEVLKTISFLKPLDKESYKYISISEFPFVIGKEKDKVNAVINEKSVSRTHCKLEERDGVIYLMDLGSTNGTFINGERLNKLESYRLENMDEVLISNVSYRYEIN